MFKKVITISQHPNSRSTEPRSRQRLFDLGPHEFMGAPGLSWRTNYWVKKVEKGTYWELYSSQETSLRRKEYCGTYDVENLRNYFEEVSFWLDEEYWLSIGLGRKADVIDARYFELNK